MADAARHARLYAGVHVFGVIGKNDVDRRDIGELK